MEMWITPLDPQKLFGKRSRQSAPSKRQENGAGSSPQFHRREDEGDGNRNQFQNGTPVASRRLKKAKIEEGTKF